MSVIMYYHWEYTLYTPYQYTYYAQHSIKHNEYVHKLCIVVDIAGGIIIHYIYSLTYKVGYNCAYYK